MPHSKLAQMSPLFPVNEYTLLRRGPLVHRVNFHRTPNGLRVELWNCDFAHSTESVRAHEISAYYQKYLDRAFADLHHGTIQHWLPINFFSSVIRHSSWQLVPVKWNKMLEDVDSNNSLFRFILDKRKEFWDDGKSGMSYFSILRSSIKRQMKNQKFQYSYTAEDNLKSFYSSLKKADAAHAQQERIDGHAKSPSCVRRPTRHGRIKQCVVCVHGGWIGPAHDTRCIVKNDQRKTSDECDAILLHDSNSNEGGGRRKQR